MPQPTAVDPGELRQPHRRVAPTRMEFVDRRKIIGRQMLDIFSRRFQRRQDDVAERTFLIVVGDCLR
jgi:hypothetical protein